MVQVVFDNLTNRPEIIINDEDWPIDRLLPEDGVAAEIIEYDGRELPSWAQSVQKTVAKIDNPRSCR